MKSLSQVIKDLKERGGIGTAKFGDKERAREYGDVVDKKRVAGLINCCHAVGVADKPEALRNLEVPEGEVTA
ncbi:hypothetical protein [Flagellimonas marinaquae]